MGKDRKLCVILTEMDDKLLAELSKTSGLTKSSIVRLLLKRALSEGWTPC